MIYRVIAIAAMSVLLSACFTIIKLDPVSALNHVEYSRRASVPFGQPITTEKEFIMFEILEERQAMNMAFRLDEPIVATATGAFNGGHHFRPGVYNVVGITSEVDNQVLYALKDSDHLNHIILVNLDGEIHPKLYDNNGGNSFLELGGTWHFEPKDARFFLMTNNQSNGKRTELVYKGVQNGTIEILVKKDGFGRVVALQAKAGIYALENFKIEIINFDAQSITFRLLK